MAIGLDEEAYWLNLRHHAHSCKSINRVGTQLLQPPGNYATFLKMKNRRVSGVFLLT